MKKSQGTTDGGAVVRASWISGEGALLRNPYHAVRKSDSAVQIETGDASGVEWIPCEYDRIGLERMADDSTILPQCIRAYAANICGFGIGVRYLDDQTEPTAQAQAEFEAVRAVINSVCAEMDTKEVFEQIVEARETYGCAYLEVIRSADGAVAAIDFIEDASTVEKSRRDDMPTEYTVWMDGEEHAVRKRFSRYRQTVNGRTVYFREFGDPRPMDWRDGRSWDTEDGGGIPLQYRANEILEFKIGAKPYGQIRWRGQILGIDGAYKAENLNNNYFVNGRHTPLMILIEGGMLDPESEAKLRDYMNSIRGENGQHGFMVLCSEPKSGTGAMEAPERPRVEIKDLAGILQKDELFGTYIDTKRRQVQSAFLLPDLYVGYTTEFNRATAQAAMQVAEQQVFMPERKRLAWIINNKLLAFMRLKYTETYFRSPDITNPDDLYKVMVAANQAGGLTPNKARDILYRQLGEHAEPYADDWGEQPLQITQSQSQGQDAAIMGGQVAAQIAKAEESGDSDIVPVLKAVRDALEAFAGES